MNRVLQSEQMDLQIRYWDNEACISKTRYLDSQFVLRPNAENLFASLNNGTECLQDEKMIQLSMDGPSTNWVVLSKLQQARGEKDLPPIEDLGSCILHVISGAFQTAFKQNTEWFLDKILKAMWQLFHDSPARKET